MKQKHVKHIFKFLHKDEFKLPKTKHETLQEAAGEKIAKDELPVNHTGEQHNHVVVRICV